WACPNVYIDTSGSNQWMRWMPYDVTLESLFRKYRETIGPSRILFGTDSSWFPRGFSEAYLDVQVRSMADVGYSEEERDMVLYRNAAALLGFEGGAR
ncbi:MAG TPA: amidohydrolase family protein, partial [Rectinemataceae bacterium]|nr:amidohydrolase family protein [Rectinemataceae bacterium]